ncbi:hypothetical protein B0H16DRAFT_1689382 [Mycena metata]|uniref:Uncharacterized protein n=1 Tax=Mycena metata TaxID=1033252 RepID=A0AAD7JAW4_9AGAR|nr:hypothetical protein B0H16DRAFT_1689382 [Mycena metata]
MKDDKGIVSAPRKKKNAANEKPQRKKQLTPTLPNTTANKLCPVRSIHPQSVSEGVERLNPQKSAGNRAPTLPGHPVAKPHTTHGTGVIFEYGGALQHGRIARGLAGVQGDGGGGEIGLQKAAHRLVDAVDMGEEVSDKTFNPELVSRLFSDAFARRCIACAPGLRIVCGPSADHPIDVIHILVLFYNQQGHLLPRRQGPPGDSESELSFETSLAADPCTIIIHHWILADCRPSTQHLLDPLSGNLSRTKAGLQKKDVPELFLDFPDTQLIRQFIVQSERHALQSDSEDFIFFPPVDLDFSTQLNLTRPPCNFSHKLIFVEIHSVVHSSHYSQIVLRFIQGIVI